MCHPREQLTLSIGIRKKINMQRPHSFFIKLANTFYINFRFPVEPIYEKTTGRFEVFLLPRLKKNAKV